jgi:hypothetical protein
VIFGLKRSVLLASYIYMSVWQRNVLQQFLVLGSSSQPHLNQSLTLFTPGDKNGRTKDFKSSFIR